MRDIIFATRGVCVRGRALIVALAAAGLLLAGCIFPIGASVEQRPLVVQSFGSGPVTLLFVGGLHTGPEDNTRVLAEMLARHFAEHPQDVPPQVSLYILTAANPDGSARNVHTNAHDVDLNRNWPSDNWVANACHPVTGCTTNLGGTQPLSEPETRALYDFVAGLRPEMVFVWHAQASLVEANEVAGADGHGQAYAGAAGFDYIEEWTAYTITGQFIDAMQQRLGVRAADVELSRCCSMTQQEFDRNLAGVQAVLAGYR